MNEEFNSKINIVFKKLMVKNPILLGKGGEGWIFEYGNDVLKIYPGISDRNYLMNIQKFLRDLSKNHFTFEIPYIYEVGEADGVLYTIEKKLRGIQMDKKIIGMKTSDRQKLFLSYYNAIRQVNMVSFSHLPYGQIIQTPESITDDNWTDFLVRKLDQKVIKTQEKIRKTVSDYDKKVNLFKRLIVKHLACTTKNLIHSDYFLNNVLVNDDLVVSAVLDFSIHAAVGDPRLDIAGVLTWNEIDPNIKREDYIFLYDIAKNDYGKDIDMYADLYFLFSSFYFADMEDPSFSIRNLNDDTLWNKYD